MTELTVGCRVASADGYLGSVRYIGLVPPSEGEWVGVEWDDPTRGKHDGSKQGVTYFKCQHSTGGSFVRKQKLNAGVSVYDALCDRYLAASDTNSTPENSTMYIVTAQGEHKTVEGIGLDKNLFSSRKFQKLKDVGLRNRMISHAGVDGSLTQLAPNIKELDLSRNILSTWLEIGKIASQLSKLEILNLSENYLVFDDECLIFKEAFSSLKTLILNKSHLSWNAVLTCAKLWPGIEELHANDNNISCLTTVPPNLFSNLKFLNLTGNPICRWSNLRSLSSLPKLRSILLNSCSMRELDDVREDEFLQLTELGLSNNLFEDFSFFNEINKLPALVQLNCRKNPVFEKEEYDTVREIVIAKIKRLKKFNNSAIDARERSSAEMDYLKKFGQEWKESGGDQDPERNKPSHEFMRSHPRYLELVAEYGPPSDKELYKKSSALKGNLIEIVIAMPSNPDFKPVTRRLPLSMTVANLKMLIQRLTKMEVRKQMLEYVSKENPEHIVALDRDNETLHDVSIDPGDSIHVNEIVSNSWQSRNQYIQVRKKKRMFKAIL